MHRASARARYNGFQCLPQAMAGQEKMYVSYLLPCTSTEASCRDLLLEQRQCKARPWSIHVWTLDLNEEQREALAAMLRLSKEGLGCLGQHGVIPSCYLLLPAVGVTAFASPGPAGPHHI